MTKQKKSSNNVNGIIKDSAPTGHLPLQAPNGVKGSVTTGHLPTTAPNRDAKTGNTSDKKD